MKLQKLSLHNNIHRKPGPPDASIMITLSPNGVMVTFSTIILTQMFANPDSQAISRLINQAHTIAVVGLSSSDSRPSFRVAKGLQALGYRIIPVSPMLADALGEPAYTDLESLPELPDIVDVFRAAEHIPAIVESCIRLGVKNLWLQEGIVNEAAAIRASNAGITVVMNRCLWRDAVQLGAHSA